MICIVGVSGCSSSPSSVPRTISNANPSIDEDSMELNYADAKGDALFNAAFAGELSRVKALL